MKTLFALIGIYLISGMAIYGPVELKFFAFLIVLSVAVFGLSLRGARHE